MAAELEDCSALCGGRAHVVNFTSWLAGVAQWQQAAAYIMVMDGRGVMYSGTAADVGRHAYRGPQITPR